MSASERAASLTEIAGLSEQLWQELHSVEPQDAQEAAELLRLQNEANLLRQAVLSAQVTIEPMSPVPNYNTIRPVPNWWVDVPSSPVDGR